MKKHLKKQVSKAFVSTIAESSFNLSRLIFQLKVNISVPFMVWDHLFVKMKQNLAFSQEIFNYSCFTQLSSIPRYVLKSIMK